MVGALKFIIIDKSWKKRSITKHYMNYEKYGNFDFGVSELV